MSPPMSVEAVNGTAGANGCGRSENWASDRGYERLWHSGDSIQWH